MDSESGEPVTFAKERVEHLVKSFESKRTRVIVPAPALSEVLVRAGKASQGYLNRIERSSVFRIESFDARAAVEVAVMTRDALVQGSKRGEADGTWAKIKYDRQIVAIGRVNRVEAIYSDDGNIKSFAAKFDIPVIKLSECPIPLEARQTSLQFDGTHEDQKVVAFPGGTERTV
jgi:hypothetical protein